MAKNANPFFGAFDYVEFAKMFDPAKFDMEKLSTAFKVPGVDAQAVMAAQRKNLEAMTAANRITVEATQAIARRQAEILRDNVKVAGDAVTAMTAAQTLEEKLAAQADVMKSAYAKGMSDLRELSELGQKSSQEAMDVLNARVSEGLEEMGAQIKTAA